MSDSGEPRGDWPEQHHAGGPEGAVATRASNGRGLWAMVLGIGSVVLAFIVPPLGLLLGVVAIILAVSGRRRADRQETTNRGQATTGLVTGIIGVVIGGLFTVLLSTFLWSNREELSDLNQCLQDAATAAEEQECRDRFERELSG